MDTNIEAGMHMATLVMLIFLFIAAAVAMLENGSRLTRIAGLMLFAAAFSLMMTLLTGPGGVF